MEIGEELRNRYNSGSRMEIGRGLGGKWGESIIVDRKEMEKDRRLL